MKKSFTTYFKTFAFAGFSFVVTAVSAQVTLNCESGNRAIDQGNCWEFGATSFSNSANLVISGSWSLKSNSLTSPANMACCIKSPWMLIGNGDITFKARLDGDSNGVTDRGLIVSYIPYEPTKGNREGTPKQFYTYTFPAFNVTTIREITAPIPESIKNSTKAYRISISFVGTGGNEHTYSDNFLIPGTYWSDPSKNCMPRTTVPDADSDGVPDNEDEYPADQNKAYNNYYPSAKIFGTLAFEDLWPVKGDFDFNDLVVNYRFNTVTNASNNVVEIIGKIVPRAAGTSLKNGFGFQLDGIPANKVIATSGNSISTQTVFNYAANGLEANQPFATCIVFDNFFKVMPHPGGCTIINTDKNAPFVKYDTITINMTFLENGKPGAGGVVPISQLPSNIFNFFIVANQDRGKEIHLPDRKPTSLVRTALLGTENDDSSISSGKYYKTKNNLPWAINIISGFSYPIEKVPIDAAYLHFNEWVESGGTLFPQWYTNEPGNRVNSNIY